jgi:hypothetical protein
VPEKRVQDVLGREQTVYATKPVEGTPNPDRYVLEDGSVVEVQTVVFGFDRVENVFSGNNPVYIVRSSTVLQVVSAPSELKRPK